MREVALGERGARRLLSLLAASEGARAVAEAAEAQRRALRARYEEAIVAVLELHGIASAGGVDHDSDAGVLRVTPAPAPIQGGD